MSRNLLKQDHFELINGTKKSNLESKRQIGQLSNIVYDHILD
jgi:hypothetical protein